MSLRAMNWAYGQKAGGPAPKLILVTIADHADEDGFAYPKVPSIAEATEVDPRTVQRYIRHLEELGLLEIRERYRENGSQTSNGYQLHLSRTADATAERGGDSLSPPPGNLSWGG